MLRNALVGFENPVDGFARGDRQLEELQRRIAFEVIVDCLLTGYAAQALRGLIANEEHLLNDQRIRFDRRVLARTRVALQDLLHWHVCGLGFPKAFEPFFDPCL